MSTASEIIVKGTRYYSALPAFNRGDLKRGAVLELQRQPENAHDSNAVAVTLGRTGEMLGHISRATAPKISRFLLAGKVREAHVLSARIEDGVVELKIRICFSDVDTTNKVRRESVFGVSASELPKSPGVYTIINLLSGRSYVGSSNDVRKRVQSHIGELLSGTHSNHLLQRDFTKHGADKFEAILVSVEVSGSDLQRSEQQQIQRLLKSGTALYNFTRDGRGIRAEQLTNHTSKPISDRIHSMPVASGGRRTHVVQTRIPLSRPRQSRNDQTEQNASSGSTYTWIVLFIVAAVLASWLF
jgi:group I intron endonuclease